MAAKEIIFTDISTKGILPEYFPKPVKKSMPEWYLNLKSHVNNDKPIYKGFGNFTIKRCMPVLDVLTTGYYIYAFQDIYVEQTPEGPAIVVKDPFVGWDIHNRDQLEGHPMIGNYDAIPKFLNPWAIRTPQGYSCLFINPVHHANPYFDILEGIVDTDNFLIQINFPLVLRDRNFEGVIPAGTPIVQVIPFKRNEWKMKIGNKDDHDKVEYHRKQWAVKLYESYKKNWWNKKSFN